MIDESKKTLYILLFLAHSISCFSQGDSKASAQKRLSSYQQKDSTRVKLLIEAANELLHTKPGEGFVYANEAIEIADAIGWQQGKISALQLKGNLFYVLNDIVNAMEVY